MYLITDEHDKTWRGIQWGPNISHSEENDNYHFYVYHSPLVLLFMYPAYEGDINNPRVWKCQGKNLTRDEGFRQRFETLTTLEPVEVVWPTPEQRMTFALINTLTVNQNKYFSEWAMKYLKKEDQSLEAAQKMIKDVDFDAACGFSFALEAAIEEQDFLRFPAYAVHRAWHDSLDTKVKLDWSGHCLEQTAQIVLTVSVEDIVQILMS
jgi:hypothetical protein